jgi:hypothetical protein
MATRFYLCSPTANPNISPAYGGGWTTNTWAARKRMFTVKDSTAMASTTFWANGAVAANATTLVRQFVSDPMVAGIAFTTGSTIKCYIRCFESGANDNINRQPIGVYVYSNDGLTLRATMKTVAHIGPNTTEWNTALRNKTLADGDVLGTGHTTLVGDRLVIEVGAQVSSAGGTTVTGTMSFGCNSATDIAENETGTTADNPWFEISNNITFLPVRGYGAAAYTPGGQY